MGGRLASLRGAGNVKYSCWKSLLSAWPPRERPAFCSVSRHGRNRAGDGRLSCVAGHLTASSPRQDDRG